jgi:hypothetical protein
MQLIVAKSNTSYLCGLGNRWVAGTGEKKMSRNRAGDMRDQRKTVKKKTERGTDLARWERELCEPLSATLHLAEGSDELRHRSNPLPSKADSYRG